MFLLFNTQYTHTKINIVADHICLILNSTRGILTDVQMVIRTTQPDGLLFWVSENLPSRPVVDDVTLFHAPSSNDVRPLSPGAPWTGDYMYVGLKDGHVRLRYDVGGGDTVVVWDHARLDDNKEHVIRARRYDN